MAEREEQVQLELKETKQADDGGQMEIETDEISDRTLLCGWGKWRPSWLQPFSRPSVFLIFIFIFALTSGNRNFNM